MNRSIRLALAVALLPLAACRSEAQADATSVPLATPTSAVVDDADMLAADEEAALEIRLREYWDHERTAIVVNTIPSLEGETIEERAFDTFNRWGIGDRETNRGVLLLISEDDRQLRIEVGCGLETILTNDQTKRIIDDEIVPQFREGNFPGGIESGVSRITTLLDESDVEAGPASPICLEIMEQAA